MLTHKVSEEIRLLSKHLLNFKATGSPLPWQQGLDSNEKWLSVYLQLYGLITGVRWLVLLHLTGFRHKADAILKEYKDVTSESTFFPFHSQVSVTANSHFEEVWKITVFQGIRASVSNWSWQTPLKPSCVNSICFTFSLLPTLSLSPSHTQFKVKYKHTHTLISLQTDLWWWKSERGTVIYLKRLKPKVSSCRRCADGPQTEPADSAGHMWKELCVHFNSTCTVSSGVQTDENWHTWTWLKMDFLIAKLHAT